MAASNGFLAIAGGLGAPELLIILLNVAILVAFVYLAVRLVRFLSRRPDERRVAELERRVEELEDALDE